MVTESTIYWITRLDAIKDSLPAFAVPAVLLIVSGGLIVAHNIICDGKYCDAHLVKNIGHMPLILGVILAVISWGIGCFLPTTKEMAAIIVIPKIARAIESNERVQKFPSKLMDLTDDWMEELKPKKKEGGQR